MKYFSALNKDEATEFIGQEMEFANGNTLLNWGEKKSILKKVYKDRTFLFISESGDAYPFIRTCEPVINEALEKSIKQWQIMVDNPKLKKRDVYKLLGGENKSCSCFLCDKFEDYDNGCPGCINWGVTSWIHGNTCCFKGSVFRAYNDCDNKATRLAVLEYLRSIK